MVIPDWEIVLRAMEEPLKVGTKTDGLPKVGVKKNGSLSPYLKKGGEL